MSTSVKSHRARDTITLLQRETPEFIPQRCGHWPLNSPGLNPVIYGVWDILKRGSTIRGSMMWRSWKNVCWGSGDCRTTPSSRQRLRSGLLVWVHVFVWMVDILNINFEPMTLWRVLFVLLIPVPENLIDINMDRVKHCVKCVTFVSEIFTQCGSNKTKVWRKFLRQVLCHSLAKLHTKNCENRYIFVKVRAKKSVAPILLGYGIETSYSDLQRLMKVINNSVSRWAVYGILLRFRGLKKLRATWQPMTLNSPSVWMRKLIWSRMIVGNCLLANWLK